MKSAGVEGEMEIERCQLWAGRLGWRVRGSVPECIREHRMYGVIKLSRTHWLSRSRFIGTAI